MTFVKLGAFLQRAFDRIDRNHTSRNMRESGMIETAFKQALNMSSLAAHITFKNGVVILHTSSPILKHRVFAEKNTILSAIQTSCPGVLAREIIFRGPKS